MHLLTLRGPKIIGFISLTLAFVVWQPVISSGAAETPPSPKKETVLGFRLTSFSVKGVGMEEALRELRRKDYTKVLIGFEKIPHRQREEENRISVGEANTSVGEVLERLCEADPRYTYEVIDGILINVLPRGAKNERNNLLNMLISRFSVHGAYTSGGVIQSVAEFSPELRKYLREKEHEYYAAKGIFPGSPGVMSRGNMTPQFHLDLENKTVRQVLNDVVLYSLLLYRESSPDATGWKPPPTSWIYEFVVDPDAATGLGGVPRWDTLD
ncbi:MAG: hypothetical protein ACRD35_01315 [Candidatus Acidiferrales bacterium]